jgi:NAD-dependent DNA ligase
MPTLEQTRRMFSKSVNQTEKAAAQLTDERLDQLFAPFGRVPDDAKMAAVELPKHRALSDIIRPSDVETESLKGIHVAITGHLTVSRVRAFDMIRRAGGVRASKLHGLPRGLAVLVVGRSTGDRVSYKLEYARTHGISLLSEHNLADILSGDLLLADAMYTE